MNWKIGQKKMFRISIDKIIENREDKQIKCHLPIGYKYIVKRREREK